MNARGQRSYDRAFSALTASADHMGSASLSHKQLAARIGLHERQTQRLVIALEAAGKIVRVAARGFANAYRILDQAARKLLAAEARKAWDRPEPSQQQQPGPVLPRALSRELLDHHPNL